MLHNGYQTARLLIGVMYGGYTVAPLNLLAQRSQLAYVLEHSDTRLVFTSAELEPRLREALGERRARDRSRRDRSGCDRDLRRRRAAGRRAAGDRAKTTMRCSCTPRARPACPKASCTRTAASSPAAYTRAKRTGSAPTDRVHVRAAALSHQRPDRDRASRRSSTAAASSCRTASASRSYWETVARHRCTWINVVPTIIAYLLNAPGPRELGLDVSRVKFCRSASAPLPPELHRAFEERFGIGVIETFGMTETNAPCFTNPLRSRAAQDRQPRAGVRQRSEGRRHRDAARRSRRASPGEIMVRGDNVMKCYYKDPDNTARTMQPDGWMHTGDLGYLDEDGFLFVTGRMKELIIKGGENIAPREIDEALLRHPAVLEAAAVGIPDASYGQEIMACVVLKPGAVCTPDELLAHARAELGRYKSPKVIRIVEVLPKGPSGKVQRLKLERRNKQR